MATTLKQIIAPAQVAATATTYYTVPAGKTCVIRSITFCNTTGTLRTIDVHFVPSGGSASDTNTILKTFSVDTLLTQTPADLQNHVLPAGSFIQLNASVATAISVFASGTEVS